MSALDKVPALLKEARLALSAAQEREKALLEKIESYEREKIASKLVDTLEENGRISSNQRKQKVASLLASAASSEDMQRALAEQDSVQTIAMLCEDKASAEMKPRRGNAELYSWMQNRD